MSNIFTWIKSHKIVTGLLFLAGGFVFICAISLLLFLGVSFKPLVQGGRSYSTANEAALAVDAIGGTIGSGMLAPSSVSPSRSYLYTPATPRLDVEERRVVTESQVALLVRDVRQATDTIIAEVQKNQGYVVQQYVQTPEERSSYGYVVLRIPNTNVESMLGFLRGMAVKVASENISGTDITDQYMDAEERLAILQRMKTRFEEILQSAQTVEEILKVEREILNVQSQIDSLTGSLEYMEQTSASSLITVNLSTDELALPYSPGEWRPGVVYRYAVRSMIRTLRGLGNLAIWLGVYAVFWLPVVIIIVLIVRARRKNRNRSASRKTS